MSVWAKIARSNFYIKLTNWEYWPFGIVQFPLFIYWLWLSFRARSLVFFSASNPGIAMGGMLGESKYDILKKIPLLYLPKTVLIHVPATTSAVMSILETHGFRLPVIFKPDMGERGFMVKRIDHERDIESYLNTIRVNFLVQDLVVEPLEFGVFYERFPSENAGKVTSVVIKEMLSVTGDGKSTLRQLIFQKDRAKLQWKKLEPAYRSRLTEILPNGAKLELVSIGNHALGTKFLNGNYLINDKLSFTFDQISKQVDGFYFGRYDLRCQTLDDLYNGNVKIVELNGCGAEPAHIYDPGFSLVQAFPVLFRHWKHIFEIARQNNRRGIQYISYSEARRFYRRFKEATRP